MNIYFLTVRHEMNIYFLTVRHEMSIYFLTVRHEMNIYFLTVRHEMNICFLTVRHEMNIYFLTVRHGSVKSHINTFLFTGGKVFDVFRFSYPHGQCRSVGVGGYLLGGGMNWLGTYNKYGYGWEYTTNMDIVENILYNKY